MYNRPEEYNPARKFARKEICMEYITFDLEWNQPYPGQPLHRDLTAEIIQIGAVKMDADFHIIDQFKADVKPTFYTHIKREVQQLTGISAEALRRGESSPSSPGATRTCRC